MKIIYTDQSFKSLEESLQFLIEKQGVPIEKVLELKARLLDRVDGLVFHPESGQIEEYLEHLNKNHRRLIEGYFKIIYRIENDSIYVTDFFDARKEPDKMKG